ncbi:MAG: hypothetical protein ACRC5Q_07805 [Culicoidibacterales bacterium]
MEIVVSVSSLLFVSVLFKISAQRWRRKKFVQGMTNVLTIEHAHFFKQKDIRKLYEQLSQQFKVDKQNQKCYHQIVDVLAKQYERQLEKEALENAYEELAHLYHLLQLGIDDQHEQRIFATLFMKTRNCM